MEKLLKEAFKAGVDHEKSKVKWNLGGELEPDFNNWYTKMLVNKNDLLHNVRQQSELLKAFIEKEVNPVYKMDTSYEFGIDMIDDFIKDFNHV